MRRLLARDRASPVARMDMCPWGVMLSMGGLCAGSPEAKVLVAFLVIILRNYSYGNQMSEGVGL